MSLIEITHMYPLTTRGKWGDNREEMLSLVGRNVLPNQQGDWFITIICESNYWLAMMAFLGVKVTNFQGFDIVTSLPLFDHIHAEVSWGPSSDASMDPDHVIVVTKMQQDQLLYFMAKLYDRYAFKTGADLRIVVREDVE